ncbi:MAG TPA: tryptophan-rich sensory protein [Pyrinomonadaceae bacterium]
MRTIYAVLISTVVCGIAAALEGLCAGKNVKAFFASLRMPSFSAPLWVWSLIGGGYYLIFGFILYRLLRLNANSLRWSVAITLVVLMMIVNALTNYVIFRARNLHLSYLIGAWYPLLDVSLFLCLLSLDTVAALALIPYLLYRIYGVWWGYALWKNNREPTSR